MVDSPEAVTDYPTPAGEFFGLTPDRVLDSVERAGQRTTGLCYALNSLENRVYEVELEDRSRVVCKFYRPGRWGENTILDEHRLLLHLKDLEVPACAPLPFPSGQTLEQTEDGIFFAVFPRVGGRPAEDLSLDDYAHLGRTLGRIHNASAGLTLKHRPTISPATYGSACLHIIRTHAQLNASQEQRYSTAVETLVELSEPRFAGVDTLVAHGDCHRGNLLRGPEGWFFFDFDDMGTAVPVQDVWLLLPARREDCPEELDALLEGYEQFRSFDHSSVRLIEPLRGLRYVRYAAWIASRWTDPSFVRAFPHWGTENYWEEQIADINEQLRVIRAEDNVYHH